MEPIQLLYPSVFSAFPTVTAAESTRHGGVSTFPYSSLNLGLHTDDDKASVAENRRRFFAACGFSPDQTAGSHQIHGAEVLRVDAPGYFSGFDALITQRPNMLISVTVADCTPLLLFDPVQKVVAAVHAGWKGTIAGIAGQTLEAMRENFGTRAADCLAYIGTCIDHCDFEVDADVADHFTAVYKQWDEDRRKFLVDLKSSNRDQLLAAGLQANHIQISPYSTVTHHEHFFSHRRDRGQTGRMLAAIGMHS